MISTKNFVLVVVTGLLMFWHTVTGERSAFNGMDHLQLMQTNSSSNSSSNPSNSNDLAIGLVACAVSTVFFGSAFVPVKKFDTGDGMFYQWILCSAIWMAGLFVQLIRKSPPFQPFAMIGGLLWATGNICVVPILKTLGLSLGMLIWNGANLITGWASGRFGWFGIKPQVPAHTGLNYAGVALAVVSVVVYVFVKSEIRPSDRGLKNIVAKSSGYQSIPGSPELPVKGHQKHSDAVNSDNVMLVNTDESWTDRLTTKQKKIVGVSLSLISGVFYGLTFDPITYLTDNRPGISQNGLDYVFSHYCGIFITSSVYFIIYAGFKKNHPPVFPKAMLPGIASGVLWAVAQSAWFVANQYLSQAVSFPIITTGPGIVASLWGVLAFKEIRGRRNYLILMLAFSISLGGATLSAFSKNK